MNRSRFALATALGLLIAAAVWHFALRDRPGTAPDDPAGPNIVLIIIDALRADRLSSYGFPHPTSPEVDRLADHGVRFARVIAQSSWTRPSIGSMLTSRYPRSIGIYKERLDSLDPRFETLAEVLQQNGYTTVGATANPNINSVFRFDQGFDRYVDSDVLWEWMRPEEGKVSYADHRLPASREILDGVLAWVSKNGAPPCYVQVNLMEVHRSSTEQVSERLDGTRFRGEPNAPYLRALHHVSREIGRFVRLVSDLPGWDNTLFVVTSDHGEGLTDHPDVPWSITHGHLLYESHILVPLILYNPEGDLPAGRVVEERVRLLDLMPTLLEYAGVPAPADMDGASRLSLVRGDGDLVSPREHLIVETEYKTAEKIGVYAPDWKYIENRDGHPGTNRRALQRIGVRENGRKTDEAARYPQIVEELRAALGDWESAHPKAPHSIPSDELSPAEIEQLRALGYLD